MSFVRLHYRVSSFFHSSVRNANWKAQFVCFCSVFPPLDEDKTQTISDGDKRPLWTQFFMFVLLFKLPGKLATICYFFCLMSLISPVWGSSNCTHIEMARSVWATWVILRNSWANWAISLDFSAFTSNFWTEVASQWRTHDFAAPWELKLDVSSRNSLKFQGNSLKQQKMSQNQRSRAFFVLFATFKANVDRL